jgi:hypothetical protein
MANHTITTGDVFIPEIWSAEVIRAVRANLVLANLVWRFDADVAKMGDTVHVPSIANLVANDKTAGVATSPQAPTETNTDISIDKHKETTFFIEDNLDIKGNRDLVSMYTGQAGYAIAKQIDTDLAALAASFSQTKGSYNTAITTDVVLDSIKELDDEDVPMESRYFVFRPDVKRDLLDLAAYTSSDFVDGKPVQSGMIGDLYGVQTFMSNNIVKSTNNTDNMLFHKDAIALAMQTSPRTQSAYDLEFLGTRVTVDTMYGVKEMRDVFGVLVKT